MVTRFTKQSMFRNSTTFTAVFQRYCVHPVYLNNLHFSFLFQDIPIDTSGFLFTWQFRQHTTDRKNKKLSKPIHIQKWSWSCFTLERIEYFPEIQILDPILKEYKAKLRSCMSWLSRTRNFFFWMSWVLPIFWTLAWEKCNM